MIGRRPLLLGLLLLVAAPTGSRGAPAAGAKPPALSAARWYNTAEPVTLESLRGKVVLLDFWGVWCTPCREEMPKVTELHRSLAARGLVILMIHTPQKAELIPAYLEENRIPLVVAVDTGDTAAAYGVDAYPTYVLIDAAGLVVSTGDHPPDRGTLDGLLAAAGR